MYRVVIAHGKAEIEYPFEDRKEALDMYMRQCIHHVEACAFMGDRCTISLRNSEGVALNKTEIISSV